MSWGYPDKSLATEYHTIKDSCFQPFFGLGSPVNFYGGVEVSWSIFKPTHSRPDFHSYFWLPESLGLQELAPTAPGLPFGISFSWKVHGATWCAHGQGSPLLPWAVPIILLLTQVHMLQLLVPSFLLEEHNNVCPLQVVNSVIELWKYNYEHN